MSEDDQTRGLYEKFRVERTDGSSAPGGRHHACQYFVLDLTHDPHALPAIKAYAESCRDSYPVLSSELLFLADEIEADLMKRTTQRSPEFRGGANC